MVFQEVTSRETARIYTFPAGDVRIENVVRVCVRPSGSHRLETGDGRKFIVPTGWLSLEIVADTWSF